MSNVLTPELSHENPDFYKEQLLVVLGNASVSGLAAIEQADIHMQAVSLDPLRWHSQSLDEGHIRLGTAPMETQWRKRLLFQEEDFDYEKEVAYRLLHEVSHPLLASLAETTEGQALTDLVIDYRKPSRRHIGLTALGSLDHFRGIRKFYEDATELITRYYWGPEYLEAYAASLVDPADAKVRQSLGLATLSETGQFLDVVSAAAEAAIA